MENISLIGDNKMNEKQYIWWKSMIKKYKESKIGINCIAILFLLYMVIWND